MKKVVMKPQISPASATVNEVNEFTFETGGTSWTCTGDSGGPARAADGTIVGVTSIGTSGCNDDVSYYVRVDRYATAIKVFLDTKAPPSCQTEQGCDVFEDNSWFWKIRNVSNVFV